MGRQWFYRGVFGIVIGLAILAFWQQLPQWNTWVFVAWYATLCAQDVSPSNFFAAMHLWFNPRRQSNPKPRRNRLTKPSKTEPSGNHTVKTKGKTPKTSLVAVKPAKSLRRNGKGSSRKN